MRRWSVVHISMYAWHICFYPSIIATSAVSADVNYRKGHSNNVHGQEQQKRYNTEREINCKVDFRFPLSVPFIEQLF